MDTMMIKTVCEMLAGEREETGFGRKREVIDKAHRKLFDFDYPIFDEAYRPVLEKKILNHYYMREINADTIGQFQHYLEITLNEVMPYYNQLYQSELLEFNPIYDVDYTRTHTLERDETREGDTDEKTIRKDTTDRDTSQSHTAQTTLDSDVASSQKTLGQGTEETSGLHSSEGSSNTTTTDKTVNVSDQESTAETSAEENSDTQRNEWNLYLDTPQGSIASLFTPNEAGTTADSGAGAGEHLTNARRIMGGEILERTNTGDSSSNVNTTQNIDVDGTNLTNTTESGTTSGSKDTTQDIQETGSIAEDATTNTSGTVSGTDDMTFDSDRQMNRAELMNINNIQQYSEHVQGKRAGVTYSKMLTEFRNTFLNVDRMILKDLETCFYGLW